MKYSIIFGLRDSCSKKVFLFTKKLYVSYLGLKEIHPAGIVLGHIRFQQWLQFIL